MSFSVYCAVCMKPDDMNIMIVLKHDFQIKQHNVGS